MFTLVLWKKHLADAESISFTNIVGIEEMVQLLIALATLLEDLGLVPSTHMAVYHCL